MVEDLAHRAVAALKDEIFSGPLESVAFFLGIANIVLLIRRSIWNYPVGIVLVSIYAYVFFKAHLFSDALLQPFFFVVQIVGWVAWLRHRESDGDLVVESTGARQLALFVLGTALGAAVLGTAMRRWTPAAYPFWDAGVAALSVVAQIMLTLRRIENWIWWVAADLISVTIYPLKGLYLSSGLYGIFLLMAVFGFVEWRRKLLGQRPSPIKIR